MGWILENNKSMNRGMEAMGGRVVRRLRMYERELGESSEAAADSSAHGREASAGRGERSLRKPQ
jgi:hypothetical protein